MVNGEVTLAIGETQVLAATYAPLDARGAVRALLALDGKLGEIVRTSREPMVGQMRLTWWFEALERLDRAAPPAEPVLAALAAEVLPRGAAGEGLAGMIDGWERLLAPEPLTGDDLARYAEERGGTLFRAIAAVCGEADAERAAVAGRGWALADLARNVRDRTLAVQARTAAEPLLDKAMGRRWSRRGRTIGALALLARAGEATGPGTLARLLLHRILGH